MGQAFGLGALVNGMLIIVILFASNNSTTTFVLVLLCFHFKSFVCNNAARAFTAAAASCVLRHTFKLQDLFGEHLLWNDPHNIFLPLTVILECSEHEAS